MGIPKEKLKVTKSKKHNKLPSKYNNNIEYLPISVMNTRYHLRIFRQLPHQMVA